MKTDMVIPEIEMTEEEKARAIELMPASPLVKHMASLTEEQLKEAIKNMSPHAIAQLVGDVCGAVGNIARDFIENGEQIWKDHHGG